MSDSFIRLNKDEAREMYKLLDGAKSAYENDNPFFPDLRQMMDPFDPLTSAYEKLKAFTAGNRHDDTDND